MIQDYGTLKAAIADYSNRSDLTARLPDFVRRAHDRIVNECVLSADLNLNAQTVALPADFRFAVSLWLINRPWIQVTEASAEQMQSVTGGQGRPFLFQVSAPNLILYPSPEPAYAAKLLYRIVRTFFSADGDTNAFLTRYPFLYLYGALAEVGRYQVDDDQIIRYESLFKAEVDRVSDIETGEALRGPLQMSSSAP